MGTGPSLLAPYDPRARQFGRAFATMMPQPMHTMRGPHPAKACGCASDQRSIPPHDDIAIGNRERPHAIDAQVAEQTGGVASASRLLANDAGYRLVAFVVGRDFLGAPCL